MRLLMRFMRPYRGLIAVTLFAVLIDNVGTLLVPTMLANMVNTGIATGDVDYILRNGLYMLIATGMVLGCYLSARLAANVACDIRNAVYDKSLELSASDFERFGMGSMITRSLNDINVIQQAVLQTIQLVLPVPFLAVAGIIFAWFIDPAMGTLLGVVVAIVLVAAVFTVANAAPIFMRLQSFIDRMNVVLRENIVGVRVIRAFNKERHEEQRLDEVFSDYAANAIKVNHLFVGLDSSSFFLMNIAEVAGGRHPRGRPRHANRQHLGRVGIRDPDPFLCDDGADGDSDAPARCGVSQPCATGARNRAEHRGRQAHARYVRGGAC